MPLVCFIRGLVVPHAIATDMKRQHRVHHANLIAVVQLLAPAKLTLVEQRAMLAAHIFDVEAFLSA